ncbi:tetratricopeptide repeat protein [Roseibium aggregatum]|uniref:Tetratricopeptide repeat protein n=1 Tax=Roseibium aggregatum TaxID=187304 RepID=A0A939J3W2_9HYPH|nr:tetratricopeptide repeat protein [Roseibium aggregatum]MBN9670560.1 tetratricopeptide repeat protein [Roseibium aggregatum]
MTLAARKAFDEAVRLEQSGDMDKALVSYLKAQELAPNDTEIAYRAASALLQSGHAEEAQSQLRRIVFTEPDHLRARASLGNCQLLLGDTANAKQNFTDVLELEPENRNALYGLASVLLKEGKAAEASGPAKRLLDLLPDSAATLTVFAETQSKTNQYSTAIAAYRRALKIASNHVPAMVGLSEVLLRRSRFDEVVELTVRTNQLVPNDPLPLVILSDALAGKGALDDAYEAAQEALKCDRRSTAVLVRLSVLSRKLGNAGQAMMFALDAHDLDAQAQGPLNALGATLAAGKFANQARSVLTALSSGKGLDPEVRQFIEDLIQNDAEDEVSGSAFPEPSGAEKASDQPTPEPAVTRADTETGDDRRAESVSGLLPGDHEPLPNVLGLRRQDRSSS